MSNLEEAVTMYLRGNGPFKLEIGAGRSAKSGWLSSDMNARSDDKGGIIYALNAENKFPIPADTFDYVYTEHMIEHVSYESGKNLLAESFRILKAGGVMRIVTPSVGFLIKILSSDRSALEERYRRWSVETFCTDSPVVTNAFFLNNFMRSWGHTFIYDRETLVLTMGMVGFSSIVACDFNASNHAELCELENEERLPPGFLELESMILEGRKAHSN